MTNNTEIGELGIPVRVDPHLPETIKLANGTRCELLGVMIPQPDFLDILNGESLGKMVFLVGDPILEYMI